MLRRGLFLVPIVLASLTVATPVTAAPAQVFASSVGRIQQSLPPGWKMRLPREILLGGPADEDFIEQLIVRVFPSGSPAGLTIALFSCENGPQPCLVGSFSVDSRTSANARREFERHLAAAAPIQLAPGVRGYLLEGMHRKPQSIFSSVMWEQDGQLYTASFLVGERQNLLYMAKQMANNPPIVSTVTAQDVETR